MLSPRNAGRTLGVVLLAQMAAAPVVAFRLTRPVVLSPEMLANVAAGASRVRGAALLLFAMGALAVALAVTAVPVLRPRGERLALWLLALGAVSCMVHVGEGMTLLSLVSLSQDAAAAGAGDVAAFRAAGTVLYAGCVWGHYAGLLIDGAMALVLYALLFPSMLVHRTLAAFGVGAAAAEMATVTMPMLGYPVMQPLLVPLGVCHLLLVTILLARGFEVRRTAPHDGARKVRLSGA
jgi:hypothetical protein